MDIIYHFGAHCTDEERLMRCLLKNRAVLAEQGIVIPGPARYRKLMRDTALALKGAPANRDTQEMVLEQIMEAEAPRRLVLSWDHFLAYPHWSIRGDVLYPSAAERVRAFRNIFPQFGCEFFLAIRNPATLLPGLFAKQAADRERGRTLADFFGGVDIHALRWSQTLQSVLDHNPGLRLTVWSDEDTPLIWPEVLQAITDHAPDTVLEDTDELLEQIMSAEGMARMKAYLAAHPPETAQMRRKIVSTFLDKFALADRLAQDVALPGWTDDTVRRLTDTYERDVASIQAMPQIRFLSA
ncbi:MAG: hypothetical protein ACT4N9_08700 [Paracoccaceae bacterium]